MSFCRNPRFCRPQIAPARTVVHNRFVRREIPVIHPVVHVERINVVNVPRHIVRPIFRREINDPCGRRGWF